MGEADLIIYRPSWTPVHDSQPSTMGPSSTSVEITAAIVDRLRWEHAVTDENVEFGEDIRWLWRDQAADLLVPAADYWSLITA